MLSHPSNRALVAAVFVICQLELTTNSALALARANSCSNILVAITSS